MNTLKKAIVTIFGLLTFISSKINAEETLPLWEVGVAVITYTSPDYPGSNEQQYLTLPVPIINYRGEFLRADGKGIRGVFLETDDLELNISLDGNLPTDDDNDARVGMSELDPLIEVGPSLEYSFYRSNRSTAGFRLPIRVAVSIFGDDNFVEYQGYVVNPEITYQTKAELFGKQAGIQLSGGALFGYDGINEYFYDVPREFANLERPYYTSQDGYMGSELAARVSININEHMKFFASTNLSYLGGAKNENSRLFKDDHNITFAMGLTWSFYQSSTRVPIIRR